MLLKSFFIKQPVIKHTIVENKVYSDGSIGEKTTYTDGTTYEGLMTDGFYNGQGTMKWINGASYKGGWKNGKKD